MSPDIFLRNIIHVLVNISWLCISAKWRKIESSYLFSYVSFFTRFLYVDVGCQGRISDGGVFNHTSLHHAIENNDAGLPTDAPYPGQQQPMPYAMVADEAFPLRSYIMKPFAQRNLTERQRIYNYILSRARRTVENAFGFLANRYYSLANISSVMTNIHMYKFHKHLLLVISLCNFGIRTCKWLICKQGIWHR